METENVRMAIEVLENAQKEVHELLSPFPLLQIRSNTVLDTLKNGLAFTTKQPLSTTKHAGSFEPKPITSILGRKLKSAKKHLPNIALIQNDDVEALRGRAKEAYATFVERDSKDLLIALNDMDLRAVAKLAGMDVTPTVPEFIDVHYIDQIKEAIHAKESLNKEMTKAASGKKNNSK